MSLLLYQPIQKYKFESKSQLLLMQLAMLLRCINQYKNTNLSFDKMGCVLAMAKKSASCFLPLRSTYTIFAVPLLWRRLNVNDYR